MAYPGAGSPPNVFKKAGSQSVLPHQPDEKGSKEYPMGISATWDGGKAPTSRVYTRDYSKGQKDPDQTDLITAALGNPFRL